MPGTNVTVPKRALDAAVYRAEFRAAYQGDMVKQLLATEYLLELYRQNPAMDKDRALWEVQRWQDKYDQTVTRGESQTYQTSKAQTDRYLFAVETLTDLPGVSITVGPLVRNLYKKFVDEPINKEWQAVNKLIAAQEQHKNWQRVRDREDQILDNAMAAAAENPTLKAVLDLLHGPATGVSISDVNAGRLIDNSPRLKQRLPKQIRDAIRPDGTLAISPDELRALAQAQHGALMGAMEKELALLKEIEQQQQDLINWKNNEEARRALAEKNALEDATRQAVLEAAGSAVYLISTFAGMANEKLGRDLSAIGNAWIKLTEAALNYRKTAETLAALGNLGAALGGMVLTGNVVSVALNLVSLLGEQGPSPEQLILDELGKLRTQVGKLRSDMAFRFNRIDEALNRIFSELDRRFDDMAFRLEQVRRESLTIQEGLVRIHDKVDRLAADIIFYLDEQEWKDLKVCAGQAVDYDRSRPGVAMSFEQYDSYERELHGWATVRAKTDLPPASYADEDVLTALSGRLDAKLNYLNGWLVSRGVSALADGTLANPAVWALSARAYAELALDWPQHAGKIAPYHTQEVWAVGDELRAALRKITLLPTGQPNQELFKKLLDNYTAQCAFLGNALDQVEKTHLANWRHGLGRDDAPNLDFWGGTYQATSYFPPTMAQMTRTPENTEPVPLSLARFVPIPFLLADYMKLDPAGLSATYRFTWTDHDDIFGGWPEPHPVGQKAMAHVLVSVAYNGTHILTRTMPIGQVEARPARNDVFLRVTDRHMAWQWSRGPKLMDHFWDRSAPVPLSEQEARASEQLLEQIAARVSAAWPDLQRSVCASVLSTLATDLSLQGAHRCVSGAKALVDAFVTLGMPCALAADDFLRSLLYGEQSLYDGDTVAAKYQRALQPEPGSLPQANVRNLFLAEAGARAEALREHLYGYLSRIAQEQHQELHPLIEDALARLHISSAVTYSAPVEIGNRPWAMDQQDQYLRLGDVDGNGRVTLLSSNRRPTAVRKASLIRWDGAAGRLATTWSTGSDQPGGSWVRQVDDWQLLGDVDGDGLPEILVKRRETAPNIYVGLLRYDPGSGGVTPAWMARGVIPGGWGINHLDAYLPLGDIDKDGKVEVLVRSQYGGPDKYVGLLRHDPASGGLRLSKIAKNSIAGGWGIDQADAYFNLGDIDGDGAPEILVKSQYAGGERYVGLLRYDAPSGGLKLAWITQGVMPGGWGITQSDTYHPVGDIDKDGRTEVLVRSTYPGRDKYVGVVRYDPASGGLRLSDIAKNSITGGWGIDQADGYVALGDIDGDGASEVLVKSQYDGSDRYVGLLRYDGPSKGLKLAWIAKGEIPGGWGINQADAYLPLGDIDHDCRAEVMVRSQYEGPDRFLSILKYDAATGGLHRFFIVVNEIPLPTGE